MAKFVNPTKVVTGKNTRFSCLVVNEPKAINGGTPKYSVSLIIPKTDTVNIEKVKAAIQAAYDEGQSKLKGTSWLVTLTRRTFPTIPTRGWRRLILFQSTKCCRSSLNCGD